MKTLFAFLLTAVVAGATTLSGTLNMPNATGITGTLALTISQQGSVQNAGGCGGPVVVVPTVVVRITVTSGVIQGSPSVYGNDCILPANLYYNVRFSDANGNLLFTDRWVISGSSVDVGTIISAVVTGTTTTLGSTGLVLQNPTGTQTVNQPALSHLGVNFFQVTSEIVFPNGGTCTAGGCTGVVTNAVTTDTTQSITGLKTFAANVAFSSGATLGTPTGAPPYAYINDTAFIGGFLRLQFGGTLGSPADFFGIKNTALHTLDTLNSSGDLVWRYQDFGESDPNTVMYFRGQVYGSAGTIIYFVSGADIDCGTHADGYTAIRVDASPTPQLQTCLASSVYKLSYTL